MMLVGLWVREWEGRMWTEVESKMEPEPEPTLEREMRTESEQD